MARYLINRLGGMLVVLAVVAVAVFLIVRVMPGDPATILVGADATPADQPRPAPRCVGVAQSVAGSGGRLRAGHTRPRRSRRCGATAHSAPVDGGPRASPALNRHRSASLWSFVIEY